jgi:hypothetical protein
MTARLPLWYNSGDLSEMTSTEIGHWIDAGIFVYAGSPTSVLTVVGGSGSLAAMSDTRKTAGATSTNASAFVAEGSTAEPGTATVSYDRIHQAYTTSGVGQTADTGITFPVWWNSAANTIQSMTLTDFKDTFVSPAITKLTSGTESNTTGGTYTITTSSTAAAGYTNISTTPVYIDTRANTGAYTAAGIPETLDQPTTITNYYLHRRNGADVTPTRNLLLAETDGLIEGATATMKSLIGNWIRYDVGNTGGQKAVYTVATSGGSTRGTGMVDTRLNGAGNYQQKLINANDYRSQEFPNGSAATITTYALRIAKGG